MKQLQQNIPKMRNSLSYVIIQIIIQKKRESTPREQTAAKPTKSYLLQQYWIGELK